MRICSAVSTEYRRVIDRQTDKRTSCDGIVRDRHTRRAVKTALRLKDNHSALTLRHVTRCITAWYRPTHDWAYGPKQVYRRRYESRRSSTQSPNCILKTKKNKIWRKNDFQCGGWHSYTLQCGTIMTLISPGNCTLECGMWLWNHDSEFTKWQHPAM